ncbi:sporulation initiation factor Spo0A C-terminal domain-containing protein [Ruminococcus sp.]|uniref:sporulation initiation factor Spo0A C-terminal domain-containing protein n=1 Tax=Ruminococcus sp. TaxID=41978 RepID=UPI0025F72484|nr:sporulation initiation factor Spo0A C-terminal domain-containing protein [Ruminococcus sp.]MBQ9540994.1 sporulation initiation factor Spo0A C-terminal domain-containing protein [Ruminococcus sp.]
MMCGNGCARVKKFSEEELYADITRILTALCFKQKYSGYRYVREAVRFAVQQEYCGGISKSIYPLIAKQNGISSAAVESGIRSAIRKAWQLTDSATKRELFGAYGQFEQHVPSNSEFVYMIAERLVYNGSVNKNRLC